MTSMNRVDLKVPFAEKDLAKFQGARWDQANQTWYAPPGADLERLKRWLPRGVSQAPPDPILPFAKEAERGVALAELLDRVQGVIDDAFPTAEWVRAEVAELRGKNGHLYLTLTERNDRGDILAQIKGVIWRNRAESIAARFEQATGAGLKTDIKILCLARLRFDPLYGLDLIIEDVDPSYTLGDLAAKLARVRESLEQLGLYDRNRRLFGPVEFTRVAVLSPETSAGLGDFRREADHLQRGGLCEFHFFSATFQGVDAPASIHGAVLQALAAHQRTPFDALVVIRGGGSVTDLAWLNDLELAKLLCQSPIPVFTGIGHERDSTILDEIAHTRFDTPSKVALHIKTTITDNAWAALDAWERISVLIERIVHREKVLLLTQEERLETGARTLLTRVEWAQEGFFKLIQTATSAQLRQVKMTLDVERTRLITATNRTLASVTEDLEKVVDRVADGAVLTAAAARKELDNLARMVVGLGPQSTLKRGFAIVRDEGDTPLTSRARAQSHARLQIEFHDGRIAVTNEHYSQGNQP
jgi:exodeoxyribonuclease VII large subunit